MFLPANLPIMTRLRRGGGQIAGRPNTAGFRDLLALGDSIFAGNDDLGIVSPVPYLTFPASVVNAAVTGRTLATWATEVAAALANNPGRDCLLMGGVNDLRGGAALATVQGHFETIADAIVAAGRRVIVVDILPCINDPGMSPTEFGRVEDYNAWLVTECAARRHLFMPTWHYMQDPADPGALLPAYITPGDESFLHLSLAGAQRLAAEIDAAFVAARKLWGAA